MLNLLHQTSVAPAYRRTVEEAISMRGDPFVEVSFRPGAVSSGRVGGLAARTQREAGQPNPTPGRETQPTHWPSSEVHGDLLSDALAHGQWSSLQLSPNRSPSYARPPTTAPDSEIWRDRLLAEIEDLIAELRGKVARYTLFQSGRSLDDASRPGNQAAMEWLHQALEDIAATALGIELASQGGILRMTSAAEQDLTSELHQKPNTGTTR
jgi:hypothetical protein